MVVSLNSRLDSNKEEERSEAELDLFGRGVAEDRKDTRACVENNLFPSFGLGFRVR